MFASHSDSLRHRVTATIRDIVEIVAIVAAGVWAIYTFIYVEHIKPAGETPRILVTGTLEREGERDGLVALRYNATIRNAGETPIYLLGTAFSGNGLRFTTNSTPHVSTMDAGGSALFERDAHTRSSTPIYRTWQLSSYAGTSYHGGYELEPGEVLPLSDVFLVRGKDFDEVRLNATVAYTKIARVHPTNVHINSRDGRVFFTPASGADPDFDYIEVTLARTMLW
jgi:hypothetical protein